MSKNKNARPLAAVTGASTGIGYELAKQFAKNGFDLVIVAEEESIFEVPTELEKLGAKAVAVQIDLAKKQGVMEFYGQIKKMGRPLEALAINAGVGVSGDFARETDLNEEINLINLNITSSVVLAKLALKDMVKRGQGRVLFSSSVAATMPGPLMAVYAASKSFIQSFSEAIRNEVQDAGVTVTALMPDATETAFFERAGMQDTKVGQSEKDLPEDIAKAGFEGLMAGKDKVVGVSLATKAMVAANKVLPDTVKAKQYRKENEPPRKKH